MTMRLVLAIVAAAAIGASAGAVASAQRQSPPGRAGAPPPQSPPPASPPRQGTPPVFRAGVDLVTVDVVVVDKDGKAVRGLKSSAFTLLDRKKPQTIAAFEEVSHVYDTAGAAAPLPVSVKRDVADNRTAQSQRLVVVVVDDLHIYTGRTDKAKDLTKQIINNLGPDASMALLFTSGEHSTQVTEDRSSLLAAAETLKGRQSVRRPHSSNETNFAKGLDPEMSAEAKAAILKTVGSGQDFFENMAQYKTLEDAARMVGGGDDTRRKAFVLVSEGISKDLTGLFSTQRSMTGTPGDAGAPPPPASDSSVASDYHNAALRRAMESLRRSNVSTYAIDPRGRVAPQDLARENFPSPAGLLGDPGGKPTDDDSAVRTTNPVRLAQDGLSVLSQASGGFAVTDTDDLTGGLGRVLEDLDHYYLIGFRPADPSGNNYRPIDVRVTGHPEWTLRFRRGYMPGGPPALPAKADPLISGVMPKTDLPLRLFALPFPNQVAAGAARGAGNTTHLAISLEISAPAAAMLEADGRLHDEVSYQVLAIDEQKAQAVSRIRHAVRLALKPETSKGPMPATATYQIDAAIDVPPGRYQLRASASSTKLSKGGSVYLTVEVPDFSAAPLALSGLAIGYADGLRVSVAPADPTAGASSHPLPFGPSLDRQFARTDTLQIYAEVARRAADTAPVTVTVSVIDASDRASLSVDHPLTPGGNGRMIVIQPLSSLSPGAYRLRVTATSGSNKATREVGFVVR